MSVSANLTLKARFPLFFWFGLFFCFALFPFLLLESGIARIVQLQVNFEKQLKLKRLAEALDFMSENVEPPKYFHYRLTEIYNAALKADKPMLRLKSEISSIKAEFPGCFSFVVWNEEGALVEELTDDRRFRYFLKRLYTFFQSLSSQFEKMGSGNKSFIEKYTEEARFLKGYLGKFLVTAHLNYPYLESGLGRFILADIPGERSLFWYRADRKLTVLCLMNSLAYRPDDIAKSVVAHAGKLFPQVVSGFIPAGNLLRSIPEQSTSIANVLRTGVGQFENLQSSEVLEIGDLCVSFRFLNHLYRGYSFYDRKILTDAQSLKWQYLVKIIVWLAIIAFICYCYWLRHPLLALPLHAKIFGLFAYSSLIPLLVLLSLGFDYIHQMRSDLVSQHVNKSAELLAEIDHRFADYLEQLQMAVRSVVNNVPLSLRDKVSLEKLGGDLKERFLPENCILYNEQGDNLFPVEGVTALKDTYSLKQFGMSVLKFVNNRQPDAVLRGLFFEDTNFSKNLSTQKFECISVFEFFQKRFLYYCQPLRKNEYPYFPFLLLLLWDQEALEKEYLHERASFLKQENQDIVLVFMQPDTFNYYPETLKPEPELRQLMQKALLRKTVSSEKLFQNGIEYMVAARLGKNLTGSSIAIMIPKEKVEAELTSLKYKFAGLIILIILFSLSLSHIIAVKLLTPVKELNEAIKSMGRADYSYRTHISSKNELGQLGSAINSAMENMKELEIARIVQENLFPEPYFKCNSVELYAQTHSMTRLGGDYYDYLSFSARKIGVLIADAAGHGIPAALIMTVAKTVFNLQKNRVETAEEMLYSIQDAIYSLRKHAVKAMMTAQFVELDTETGKGRILNCGHCYPVLVSYGGKNARFITLTGTPLGVLRKVNFKSLDFELAAGESLILYSDGFLESKNNSGEEFGTDRLLFMIESSWEAELDAFSKKLFEKNFEWSALQSDDLTILIIKRSGEVFNA